MLLTQGAVADPPHNPGGPCLEDDQNVSSSSVAGYADVVQALDRIERNRIDLNRDWENRQMPMVSVDALEQYGLANIAHYPIIDITNAALSRMLMSGTARAGETPVA